jgi:ligand-binding sensor domain-containing protein
VSFTGTYVRNTQFDNLGNLWLGTNNGLFLYHPDSNVIEEISLPLFNRQSREIDEIFGDDDGLLWIGTYSNGLFIADPATKSVQHISLGPYYERTETIRAISKGVLGDYWIGTRGGLYVYSKTRGVTGFFKHDDRDNRSLANNSVLEIFHDAHGETWIGTRGGLNLLAKSKQVFRNFSALPNDNHYLNSNIIYAFWIDEKRQNMGWHRRWRDKYL